MTKTAKKTLGFYLILAGCLVLIAVLGGCSGFSNRAAPPAQVQLAVIDESLKRRCARPVEIPESDFHGVTTLLPLWQDDRIHLRTCGKRVDALVTAIEKRDAIQGAGGAGLGGGLK